MIILSLLLESYDICFIKQCVNLLHGYFKKYSWCSSLEYISERKHDIKIMESLSWYKLQTGPEASR